MRRINYKSDIPPLLLTLKVDENQITVPDCDFIVRFYIEGYEGRHYDCSHIGDVWSNCEPSEDGTKLVCYINNQRLGIGELCAEFHYISPDRRYSDGSQKSVVIIGSTELGVELVEDNGDAVTEAAIDVTLPFIYRTAYEIARYHGYTGTAEDFYSALASVVGIADAEKKRVTAEITRNANEHERIENEENRLNAENERVNAEAQRVRNEAIRGDAESDRVEQEEDRKAKFKEITEFIATVRANEGNRESNERERQTNEDTRITEEAKRVEAEKKRAAEFEQQKLDLTGKINRSGDEMGGDLIFTDNTGVSFRTSDGGAHTMFNDTDDVAKFTADNGYTFEFTQDETPNKNSSAVVVSANLYDALDMTLESMGSALDGDAAYRAETGDKIFNPDTCKIQRYNSTIGGFEDLCDPIDGKLYANKMTGYIYRWDTKTKKMVFVGGVKAYTKDEADSRFAKLDDATQIVKVKELEANNSVSAKSMWIGDEGLLLGGDGNGHLTVEQDQVITDVTLNEKLATKADDVAYGVEWVNGQPTGEIQETTVKDATRNTTVATLFLGQSYNALESEVEKKANKTELDTLNTSITQKVDKTDITQSTGTSTTAVMSQKAVSEISDKVDELEDEVLQLGKDVNGIRETGSVTSSAVGRSWIVLSTPLKAGVQYHLIFSKTANGSVAAELATAQDASAIIDSIGDLSYFTKDTEFDITPSADARFISLWRGNSVEMTVSVVATVNGMIDDVLDLEDSVSANTDNISRNSSSIADIIKVLGKGTEEQIETTYVENYRIGIDGAITSDTGCKYSAPIQVSRGDILFLTSFVSSITSPFNKTDESGSFYSPLFGSGVGDKTYLYYCIEDGYVAVSCAKTAPISALKKNSISILDSISRKIVELEDKPDREFNTMLPSYVFGIESGSFGGREYATALYPEAIVSTQVYSEDGQPGNPKVQIYARLNGTKRLLFQKSKTSKSASYNAPVESIAKVATIGGDGLVSKTFNIDYIRANRKNGQNKKMFILIIGASITQQGGYPGYLQMYGDMDNADIGGIDVKVLGSNVGTVTPSITYNYNGETKTIITHTEGRAGWTTYGIANWPFEARADGAIDTLGAEGMWYAAGLATKTPFDSNTIGQEWESWDGTTEQRLTAFTSVFGRFKPDYCEELWNALHNFHTRYRSGAHTIWYYSTGAEYADGATIPSYNSATSDPIMEQFFDSICYNPDNVFYDRDRARAYTGAYVWSYKTAFSIAKWVERYRTLDDNGNQLTLGEGTGTFVTSANINNPVCIPTIVFNGMGANDLTGMYADSFHTIAGINDAIKNLLIDFLDDLHMQLPTAPIGWGCPRQSGVFYPEDWYDFGVIPKITFYSLHRDWLNALMMTEFASLDITNKYNYVPIYFTSSPVSGQSPRYVGDFDRKDSESNLVVTGGDLGHVGEEWEKSVAYQILAWMYWAFQSTE